MKIHPPGIDLALVTFEPKGKKCDYLALKIGDSYSVRIRDEIYISGHANRGKKNSKTILQTSVGKVSGLGQLPDGYEISYDTLTVGGMSGGPVLDKKGEVVAIHGKTDYEIVKSKQSGLSKKQQELYQEAVERSNGDPRLTFSWGIPIWWYLNSPLHFSNAPNLPKLSGQNADSYYDKGNEYFDKKEDKKALEMYNEAIRINPTYHLAYYKRGLIYYNQGKYEKALENYNNGLLFAPEEDAYVYDNIGLIYYKQGKYKKALENHDKAIDINSTYYFAYYNKSNVYQKQGEYEKAISDYSRAIIINPTYYFAYYDRGNIYQEKGEYEKALSDYNEAIKINPESAFSYYNRGLIYKAKKNIEKAVLDFEKSADLYKEKGNQKWYQKSLDRLKELGNNQ